MTTSDNGRGDTREQRLQTRLVHSDRARGVEYGAIHAPVHTSVQYGFERVEDLIGVFQGTLKGRFNYARQGSPTSAALEQKITLLEDGIGTVSFATGMAALTALFFGLLRAGDHIVCARHVFGNTNSLLGTLERFGVVVSRVDAADAANLVPELRDDTKMVFVETIANPGTQVPDLDGIGRLCTERGVLYVVDNTVTSPALFRPKAVGAGLVLQSLSKSLAGHGAALGGSITDTGLHDWSRFGNILPEYRQGDPKQWGLLQLRKKGLRDMGATLSPEQSHRIALGIETLDLRMRQTSSSALELARFLQAHSRVDRVLYPMLETHPQHAIAKRLFRAGSWMLAFDLKEPDAMCAFVNRLQLPVKATGLGDNRSLIIPVAHTIYWEMGPQARAAMGISESMLRVSVGLEDTQDLLADFDAALRG